MKEHPDFYFLFFSIFPLFPNFPFLFPNFWQIFSLSRGALCPLGLPVATPLVLDLFGDARLKFKTTFIVKHALTIAFILAGV